MRKTNSKKDLPNYEDILVKRYLEELHSNRNETRADINDQKNLLLTSPYLQKVCNYSLIQRVTSSDSVRYRQRRNCQQQQSQTFSIPQTPVTLVEQHKNQITERSRSASRTRLSRPSSAPTSRATSATYTKRRRPSSFRKKPMVLKALTFKNGCNENPILLTSHTIQHFLEAATMKLQLPRAARRLFALSGQEIFEAREFKKVSEVFVSCGEDFLDPFFKEKELIVMRKQATWHMDGVRLRNESEERQSKPHRSDEELDSIHGVHLITVFENGKSNDPIIIDFNFDDEDDEDSGRDSDENDYGDKKVKLFLEKCSSRLNFNARAAYDWSGLPIRCLDDIPKFNSIIHVNKHVEFAPLWISKGEWFDPYGPLRYVTKFIDFERQLLRDLTDESLRKLKTFKNFVKREFQNLRVNEYIGDNVGEMKRFIHYLSMLREKLDDLDKKYESNRSNLIMQHIKEVSTTEKIFGGDASKGLKLRVYINGQESETTTLYFNRKDSMNEKNRKDIGVKLLLDEINRVMQKNRATGVRFTRIFDENGAEIRSLTTLDYEKKIWVSAGENWKSSVLKTLTMEFYSLNIHNVSATSPPEVSVNSLQVTKVRDYKKSSHWTALGLQEFLQKLHNNEIEIATMTDDMAKRIELSETHCFLQCKSNKNLIIIPSMSLNQKVSLREKESNEKDKKQQQKQSQMSVQDHFWLNNQFQLWSFHEDGVIANHYFQQMCLSLDSSIDIQLEIDVVEKDHTDRVVLNGYAVVLMLRQTGERSNQWKLNKFGQIYNQVCGERYVLTSVKVLMQKLEQCQQKKFIANSKLNCTNERLLGRDHVFGLQLVMLDKFPYHNTMSSKLAASQRWAIKQEGMQTIGQWRHSKLATPEWHKLAYSWPVDEDDKLIDEFDWPIVGCLIPKAPALKTVQTQFYNHTRLTLKVLKNGELNQNNAVLIMTPDLKHLMKEYENCTNITVKQLEFNWFLDNCTSTLNLPFAARRLFDQNSIEYFDLRSFKNLKVEGVKFYVTCGEAWIDPKASRKEIETKTKVLRLLEDYKKVFHYCCLRSCRTCDLVIETANTLAERSSLIISPCILTKAQRKRLDKGESIQNIIEHEEPVNEEDLEQEKKNAHQRAHERQSANKKIKWPWENIANKSMENLVTTEESVDVGRSVDKSLRKPKQIRKFNLQKFCFDPHNGYIYCTDNPALVFAVETSEGNVNEVILMRRNESDVNQRWSLKDNVIALKSRPHLVLTVQYMSFEQIIRSLNIDLENDECIMQLKDTAGLQSFLAEAAPEIFTGSTVTLQRHVKTRAGGASQKWHYEAKTGFIFAFKADDVDIDVTAAIQANICTFNVYRENTCQPGYSCLLTTEDFDDKVLSKKKKKHLCLSCSRDTRGKYKLTKLSDTTEFYCDANKDNTFEKLTGFKYLKNNHQLSMEELFFKCRNDYVEFTRRRVDSSPPKFQSRTEYTMKFLAHKNGDGFSKAGEYICGTNIKVLLDQATKKLHLTSAARKLFTEDGTPILDSQDLINYCLSYYEKVIKSMRERGKGLSESRYLKVKQEDIYDNGPNLFDLEKIFEEEEVDNKVLLKWPVHVWASTGEQFIHPDSVVKKQEIKKTMRKQIEEPGNKLDTETHVLKNMAGRRLRAMEPGVLKPVQNSDYPVTKEGHWSNVPYEEQVKQIEVETLKNEFDKARGPLKSEEKEMVNKSLYDPSSKKKRVLIYTNGETTDKAIKCWASSLDELIETSKIQLRLNKPVKFIFTQDGKIVTRLDELQQDQLLCISTGAQFVKPEERNREVEAKANWSRVRKAEGDGATHIQVASSQNPIVDVDPFGPPLVATRSLTYPSNENDNQNDDDGSSSTSSTRLKNLRFQHQNKKKANPSNNNSNDGNTKIDSLVD